jgi:hypothetical protein
MPNYRRAYIPGSTIFLTWVTYQPAPLINDPHDIALFRCSLFRPPPFRKKLVIPDARKV